MSKGELLVTILLLAFATALTRFVPFLLFGKMKKPPKIIDFLGKMLPSAMMGLLVVYCFKDTNFDDVTEIAPMLLASLGVVLMHIWKRSAIWSIAVGTALYMILIRVM